MTGPRAGAVRATRRGMTLSQTQDLRLGLDWTEEDGGREDETARDEERRADPSAAYDRTDEDENRDRYHRLLRRPTPGKRSLVARVYGPWVLALVTAAAAVGCGGDDAGDGDG